jgi:general secretion pathway protein G
MTNDQGPRGFTLIELLVVIVILAVLIALLLPAINAAVRTARNAAVSAEINQLAQALESFKAKYGDYPPSRFLAVENGNYSAYLGDTTKLNGGTLTDPTSPGAGDITLGLLAQRSVAALRKLFPRVSTTGLPKGVWYDFNGNGVLDNPYVLHGHECLVFFLGGVPLLDPTSQRFGLTGFGKDPTNPFTNSIVGNAMYNANRQPAIFEFNPGRLFLDPYNSTNTTPPVPIGIPGYYDALNNPPPPPPGTVTFGAPASSLSFYLYFSAYGNGAYDPNDVNFPELDTVGNGPIKLEYYVGFPTFLSQPPYLSVSPSPNPYTSTVTKDGLDANNNHTLPTGTVTYQKPQTYQLMSSGLDGLYGPGGQFTSSTSAADAVSVPVDTAKPSPYVNTTDLSIRQREYDNLTNFKSATLQ